MINVKVKNRTTNFVYVEFSTEEYQAFVELLKLQRKDYKGGAK